MTTIQIQKQSGNIIGFNVSGHSGYAEEGSDIVCAAISALAQNVCVGLENVLNLNPKILVNEKSANLSCFVSKELAINNPNVQTLFNTFEKSVELLLVGDKKLKKYIKLEVKNEIY